VSLFIIVFGHPCVFTTHIVTKHNGFLDTLEIYV